MELHVFTLEMIRILPKAALARKYNCSVQYVRKVLQAKDKYNSPRARAIRQDAIDISVILFGKAYTSHIEGTGNDILNDASHNDTSHTDTSHNDSWCVSGTHNYACGIPPVKQGNRRV